MEYFEMENTAMFNMQEIGARIARMRREQDLTQAELAEHLGISYQAVSSWERGASMPDISKLTDLARELHTTVDMLLSGEEAAEERETVISPELEEHAQWAVEHAADAPKDKKKINMQMILHLAPFLPAQEVEKLAMEARDEADYDTLRRLGPFLRTQALEQLLDRCDGNIDKRSLRALAPFLSTQYLDKLLDNCDIALDADMIRYLAPFAGQETLLRLLRRLREE